MPEIKNKEINKHINDNKLSDSPHDDAQAKTEFDSIGIIEKDQSNIYHNYLNIRLVDSLRFKKPHASCVNDSTIKIPFKISERYTMEQPRFGLLDFNLDGFNDLFFEYYGLNGTGLKNTVDVYFYDKNLDEFSDSCWQLKNPAFYPELGIITEYSYGLGGGTAAKYKLENGRITPIEIIDIAIQQLSEGQLTVEYSYSFPNRNESLVFYDNRVRLPQEYDYRAIIDK
ncbi:hypothetical protein GC194_04480 [bacterium]|nr:hypothetical protein [bacterium]